jgi:hypothetical protein
MENNDTFDFATDSLAFQRQLRAYNNCLSFASCGATVDRSVQGQRGIFSFRVSGALYHDMGSVFPNDNSHAAFAQIYVTGGNDPEEASHRANVARAPVDEQLLFDIQTHLSMFNSYARFFRMVGQDAGVNPNVQYALRNFVRPGLDQNVYNAPRTNEVGMVIHNDDPEVIGRRDIVLRRHSGGLLHVTDDFSGYLALRYPMFFPNGEQGWIHGWPSGTDRGTPT